jgi:hypothetical protein
MSEHLPATILINSNPHQETNLTVKIYDAVNNGSFAVLLVAGFGLVYVKRSIRGFLESPFADNLLTLIKQIEQNQEHIETLSKGVETMGVSTNDVLTQVIKIQRDVEQLDLVTSSQYELIIKELQTIKSILDRRSANNADN